MASTLKSKSFQPFTGIGDALIFLCPDLFDPGLNRRSHYLYRKSVHAAWRLPITPECCPRPILDKPEPPHHGQCAALMTNCITRHRFRLIAKPYLDEVTARQRLNCLS